MQHRPNVYDYLKIFAIVVMIIDHIGFFLFPDLLWLRVIGRGAMPIFLFLVGYNNSFHIKSSLVIITVGLQVPILIYGFFYGLDFPLIHILPMILLSKYICGYFKKIQLTSMGVGAMSLLFCCIMSVYLREYIDYGIMTLAIAVSAYFVRQDKVAWIYVVISFAWLMLLQQGFGFSNVQWYVYGLYMLVVGGCLFFLTKKNLSLRTKTFVDRGVLFFSRYALYIYIGHVALLGAYWYLIN